MPYVEVEVSLYDFDTEDLIRELKNRNRYDEQDTDVLYKIRSAYILEKPEQFRKTLEKILDENGMSV